MKKVLFFALLLMISGAASVNAQVRIGGDGEPHTTAVLDLNASDATNNGNRGLALPRVSLATETTQLNGTNPKDGTLVYNTNGSGSLETGIYYWTSGKWMKLSVDGGSAATLNIIADLNVDYAANSTDDVLLYKSTAVRALTLPTTGVAIGKKLYITDMDGGQGISISNTSAMYNGSFVFVPGGTSATFMYVGGGIWISISGY
jgi:hypothetical protein